MPGQRTLRSLNEPPAVAHEPDTVGRSATRVQQMEQALNVLQALRRLVIVRRWTIDDRRWTIRALVPDPQTQTLELTQDRNGKETMRVDKAAIPSGPAPAVPVVTRAKDKLHRVELARVAVLTRRLEPIGPMSRVQLPVPEGKGGIEGAGDRFAIAVLRVCLSPCAE